MASALLGLVLDSSTAISAERRKQSVPDFIESILRAHGPLDLSLSPVTVAELVHGIFRAQTPVAAQTRRLFVEELVSLVPVHPVTKQTGWLVGQIEGQEAAKGKVLPFSDLMIAAAAAIEQDYAVLTTNLRHFQKIPNLTLFRSEGGAPPFPCRATFHSSPRPLPTLNALPIFGSTPTSFRNNSFILNSLAWKFQFT